MTYTVSIGTLNSTIPYHTILKLIMAVGLRVSKTGNEVNGRMGQVIMKQTVTR